VTLKSGMPQRGKHYKTTCDETGSNMSKLPGAQEDMIDSSVSEEDVPTNAKTVSNQLRAGDNTSIDPAHNMNKNIRFPKCNCATKFSNGKRAYPALDVAAPMEMKRGETTPIRKSLRIAQNNSNCDYATLKVSTHIASAISSDNPFVMLAFDKFKKLSSMKIIRLNIF
jgi:hypothetical protein